MLGGGHLHLGAEGYITTMYWHWTAIKILTIILHDWCVCCRLLKILKSSRLIAHIFVNIVIY